jgi:indolepyruvate ferredoxin oxidoreductase alpha subunit
MGIEHVYNVDPIMNGAAVTTLLQEALSRDAVTLIIARRPCLLAAGAIKKREKSHAPT